MIPNDQPARKQMIERMIKYVIRTSEESEGIYTAWEIEFIESIDGQFLHKGDLTNKQCEILERIYDK